MANHSSMLAVRTPEQYERQKDMTLEDEYHQSEGI